MAPMLFYVVAAFLLLFGAGMVWLKDPFHAAYALIGALLSGAAMVALLEAEFLAFALVLAMAGGVALLLMVAMPLLKRMGPLAEGRPDEDRSFWAGIIAVLFFVITYRVLATSPWGLEDHSRMALAEAHRGAEAIRTLGATIASEFLLPFLLAGVLIGVAIAVAIALTQPEAEA